MRCNCLLIFLIVFGEAAGAIEITCDVIDKTDFSTTCAFNDSIEIKTDEVVLKHHDIGVTEIRFLGNKKILRLPIMVHESFPNLTVYTVVGCAVQKLTRKNFFKLGNLVTLYLNGNQIVRIEDNTFDDLISLKTLSLSSNKIRQTNPRAFQNVKKINFVDLESNECIDKRFQCPSEVPDLLKHLSENCSFKVIAIPEPSLAPAVLNLNCAKAFNVRIVDGKVVGPGEYPFLAALHYDSSHNFFCGGVLITSKHVVTAAHCVYPKHDRKLNPEEVFVFLGRHNISRKAERGSKTRWVREIFVHPLWNNTVVKYDADIAILELDEDVHFSEMIRPACVDNFPAKTLSYAGKVVGWGSSATKNFEEVPHQADIVSISAADCFDKAYEMGPLFSSNMFCAKGNDSGPCQGDSGGGFFVLHENTWILRGIVSASAMNFDGTCDITQHALYTQVVKFVSWMTEVIAGQSKLNLAIAN